MDVIMATPIRSVNSQQENAPVGKLLSKSGRTGLGNSSKLASLKAQELGGSARKKLSANTGLLNSTPSIRRKLGNVSNTPMGGSGLKQMKGSQPLKLHNQQKEDVFVKPRNLAESAQLKKPAKKELLATGKASTSTSTHSATSHRLPTVFEDRENCFPLEPKQFSYDSCPYVTVGLFEIDAKTICAAPFEILAEEDEDDYLQSQKENRELTLDELCDLF